MESYRVLIVDDQRDIRRLFAEALKMLGQKLEVLESPSGEEALMVAALKPIDLLIADINLPGISGLDLVRKIRKRKPELQIILETGITDPNTIREIEKEGVSAVFYKPVDIQRVLEEVKRCLGIEKPIPSVSKEGPSPELLIMKEPPSAEVILLQRLSRLAFDLGASAAALLDETGKVLAQSGDFMQAVSDPVLLESIMAAYRSSMEVTHSLLKRTPENVMCFGGVDLSLCLIPVGSGHLVLMEGGTTFNKVVLNLGRPVFQAAPELQKMVESLLESQKPVEPVPPAEVQVEPQALPVEALGEPDPEDLAKVDALFSQRTEQALKPDDMDAFWESAVDKGDTVSGDKNVLTYEQARKLGLAPE